MNQKELLLLLQRNNWDPPECSSPPVDMGERRGGASGASPPSPRPPSTSAGLHLHWGVPPPPIINHCRASLALYRFVKKFVEPFFIRNKLALQNYLLGFVSLFFVFFFVRKKYYSVFQTVTCRCTIFLLPLWDLGKESEALLHEIIIFLVKKNCILFMS